MIDATNHPRDRRRVLVDDCTMQFCEIQRLESSLLPVGSSDGTSDESNGDELRQGSRHRVARARWRRHAHARAM